jgi:hypothetical protein
MPAYCRLPDCGWKTGEPVQDIAGCLASWHVYEEHPEEWLRVFGIRPPLDPDPRIPAVRQYLDALHGSS